jgi:hypothetical protein
MGKKDMEFIRDGAITNSEESISELIDYYLKEISAITGISKETLGNLPASSITDGTIARIVKQRTSLDVESEICFSDYHFGSLKKYIYTIYIHDKDFITRKEFSV